MNKLFNTIDKIHKVSNKIKSDLTNRKNAVKEIASISIMTDDVSFFTTVLN